LDIENQFSKPIKPTSSIKPIGLIGSIRSISVIDFINSIGNTNVAEFIGNIGTIKFLFIWKISPNNYWRINIPLLWANSSRSLYISDNMLLPSFPLEEELSSH